MPAGRSCLFVLLVGACGGGGDGGPVDGGRIDARPAGDGTSGVDAFVPSGPVRLTHGDSRNVFEGQNFPDPGLLFADGDVYRFSTNGGAGHVPTTSAAAVDGPWTALSDAFPSPPAWALRHFWAPEVHEIDGTYYLYYAATIADDGSAFGEHAIGVAMSDSPGGPFTALGDAPLHRDPAGRGVIDPDVVDVGDRRYLVWSTDWGPDGRSSGVVRTIQARELVTPQTLGGPAIELLTARAGGWEQGTVEAPSLNVGPDERLHLLYSGGNFESAYATGYAICPADLGPCVRTSDAPWLSGSPANPGGLDVAIDAGGAWLGLHHGGPVSLREPYVVPLTWTPE